MRISERGQITIPQELRERYGFLPDTEVEFHARDGALELRKKKRGVRDAVRDIYGKKRLEPGPTS